MPGPVVNAAFFGHHLTLVNRHVPRVWDIASLERMIEARFEVAALAFERTMPDVLNGAEMKEAAALAMEACSACTPDAWPLFAGNQAIPFPEEPHLALWHATTQLREHRGDGHNAVNIAMGLNAGQTLALHAAELGPSGEGLKRTREWPDDEWAAAQEVLREKGLLDGKSQLTDSGRALRARIEELTDETAAAPYRQIGEDRAQHLRSLNRPFSQAVAASGTFGPPSDPKEMAKWGIPLISDESL